MIWKKIKNHFFYDFKDDITMLFPTSKYTKITGSITKGSFLMSNIKLSIIEIFKYIDKNLIKLVLLFIFAAIAILYNEKAIESNENVVIDDEVSIIDSAEKSKSVTITSNLPIEELPSIEYVAPNKNTVKYTTAPPPSPHENPAPIVLTINSRDTKEISFLYEDTSPISLPEIEPELPPIVNDENVEIIEVLHDATDPKSNSDISIKIISNEKIDTLEALNTEIDNLPDL